MRYLKLSVALTLLAILPLSGCGEADPSSPADPPLPIKLEYRESQVGNGYVLQLRNESDKYMVVVVKFTNPTLNETMEDTVELSPHDTTEIGWLEGWKFVSGETVEVRHEGYQTMRRRIP